MIAFVRGRVSNKQADRVAIDVNGVGYEVLVPAPLLETLQTEQEVTLVTYDHVRENGRDLFGFADGADKHLFEQLLGVSGVGPKSALAVMSLGPRERIQAAIAGENIAFIAGAAGVGKKSAERICVELKDKMGPLSGSATTATDSGDEALSALLALGYSTAQAAQLLSGIDKTLPTEERVKSALRGMSR